MKCKVLTAKEKGSYTRRDNTTGKIYEVVCDNGKVYDCFSERIMQKVGQEVEFDEKAPSKPEYHPTMNLAKDGGQGGGGWKGGGGGWKGKSVTEIVTTAKTMTLSYVKDLAIAAAIQDAHGDYSKVLEMVETGYKRLIKLLDLESIKEEPKTAPQEATGAKTETHKTLTQMLFELQATKTVPEAASWWNSNAGSIKALSQGDKQILFATKNEHVEVLTAGAAPNEDEIPF